MHRAFRYLPAVLLVFSPCLGAQEHTHARHGQASGSSEAAHHAFLAAERQAIERGEGFGMGMVADHNGYPGPKHVLDLKTELRLAADQQAAMEKLFAEMKEKALSKGHDLLEAESRLDRIFGEGRPEAELREQAFRVASLRAELRWVHLGAHLQARKLLTEKQLTEYMRLRNHPPASSAR